MSNMDIKIGDRISLKDEPVMGTVKQVKEAYVIVEWDDSDYEQVVPMKAIREKRAAGWLLVVDQHGDSNE